ncbi:MAG: YncE family protein [Actinobacteria bacterium]|nr:YncE family protein [Actinomycetota bacterium]
MFVGNNWEGTADVIDTATYERLVRIDVIPDRKERMAEIRSDPDKLAFFLAIREFVGEGNDQYVDDMFTNHAGTEVYVSRPSFADVVAISLDSHEILWRFPMDGYRSDHMGISPDGTRLLVSDSTANVVHELDTATGEETGRFASGDSPHENAYDADGARILHASIGRVYTPTDREELGPVRDTTKGERYFQMVDAESLEILERWDMGAELAEAGHEGMSAAVRPMAIHPDGRLVYFQVSFHHGFVEFDLEAGKVLRVADLPVSEEAEGTPREEYLLDSAHHGLAIDPTGTKLCAAGTMSDYAAIVDRETFAHTIASEGTKPYWSTNGPDGTTCWVSYSGDDEVVVIDYATASEIIRIPVGDHPQRVRNGVILEAFLAGDEAATPGGSDAGAGPGAPDDAGSAPPPSAAQPGLPATGAPAAFVLLGLAGLAGAGALRTRRR